MADMGLVYKCVYYFLHVLRGILIIPSFFFMLLGALFYDAMNAVIDLQYKVKKRYHEQK